MEAGESGTRQSVFASSNRPDPYLYRPHTDPIERRGLEPPKMATATLVNPAPAYPPQNGPYAYQQHPPPTMAGLVSPPGEARRPSSDTDSSSQRQSLPSISEVFSAKPSPYSLTAPTTPSGSQSLPPPFSASTGAPPPPPPAPRNEAPPEPRPAPHDENYFRFHPRPDGNAASHPPASSPYPFPEPRNVPKHPETFQPNGSSAPSAPPPPPPPPPHAYPPGQYPLTQGSISPRGPPPPFPPYEQHRPPVHGDDEYGPPRNRYDAAAMGRHFEAWNYQDNLYKLSWGARSVFNFADAYSNIAKEQHGGAPIPERLPSEREVTEMLNNVAWLKQGLENLREMVQHSIATEKAREGGRPKGPYDGDDDISMYGDGMKQAYGLSEVKKRRGRAAPPGRCHSCNRIDTPEWRRGPDGARTLCNACGLHYAKLERKRQLEQRSIRPKAVEDRV